MTLPPPGPLKDTRQPITVDPTAPGSDLCDPLGYAATIDRPDALSWGAALDPARAAEYDAWRAAIVAEIDAHQAALAQRLPKLPRRRVTARQYRAYRRARARELRALKKETP